MAIRIAKLKDDILLILYDYMLTSDHEGFWFSIPAITEALPPSASGAFVQRSLDALIAEKLVEQGGSDVLKSDLFALTEHGIAKAESLIEERGVDIDDYEPAPDADLILSRLHEPEKFSAVAENLKMLGREIDKSNSFAEETAENDDLIRGEIEAANTLMTASRVRVSRLRALVLPTLRYLAKTFADKSIGELATRLIALLIGLDS
ncbi:hypothetical protein [Erythrobacter sp. AP23]|uniref:hypothetical protein n=1 Tax=Erythrobacter sp. AP23 TaxID=499656 RepID=UPI00076C058E|nr:hypothetical protein [Erythrobacter sp. AP23]KWV95920.1 hypothetical protein ASS64_01465 [Erythrobacter sp. AP23]